MDAKITTRGATGPQGPQGPPCLECKCSHFPVRQTTRMICERGSRSLSWSDGSVIVNSDHKVSLVLPKIESTLPESDDYYYTPCEISIVSVRGEVDVKSSQMINFYHNVVSLESTYCTYKFISHDSGWYMITT